MSFAKDKMIIGELAKKAAEIAALPVQTARIRQWKALNALHPERPMFTVDEICWNEMNADGELTLLCTDEFARGLEYTLRKTLYKWKHVRDDMVILPYIEVPKIANVNDYGIKIDETTLHTEKDNEIVSHEYHDQIKNDDDLARFKMPDLQYDREQTLINLERTQELLNGNLGAKLTGLTLQFNLWDQISEFRGVQPILYDMMDRPDFLHRIMRKFTDFAMMQLDQAEEQGLLEAAQPLIHCSGAWSDELPAEGYDEAKPRAKDAWTYGMAQIFATISPAAHDEYDIQYAKEYYERFGLSYYGCCEPLDHKIDIVKKIGNVRKISVSPWAREEMSAEAISGDCVYLRKPNPSLLAEDFTDAKVEKEIITTLDICARYGAIPEFNLKDISTVKHTPQNLWRWAEVTRAILGD